MKIVKKIFGKSLSDILGAFTKAEKELNDFITKNSEEISEEEASLRVKRQEQEQAKRALKNIQHVVGK